MVKNLVSILIPCYNAEKYLDDCLLAIQKQSYKEIELIIVNDGSTDKSEIIIDKYVNSFKKHGKKIIKINQSNAGQASACNNGLKHVSGEFLYWQDADDVLEPEAISKMVNFLNNNEEYDFVRGNAAFRLEKDFENVLYIGKPKFPNKSNVFKDYLLERDSYCFPGVFMVRMNYFDRCNPNRDLYISPGGQNFQLILPIAYKGKCGYIDIIVYNYRIVSSSHSHSVTKFKDKIKRCDIHKDIIINTLRKIDSFPLYKYYGIILFKYFKIKVRLTLDFIVKKIIVTKKVCND